jgi:hypothetical protein
VPVLRLVRALGVVLERVGRGRVVEHCVRGRGRGAGVPAVGVALGACRQRSTHKLASSRERSRVCGVPRGAVPLWSLERRLCGGAH